MKKTIFLAVAAALFVPFVAGASYNPWQHYQPNQYTQWGYPMVSVNVNNSAYWQPSHYGYYQDYYQPAYYYEPYHYGYGSYDYSWYNSWYEYGSYGYYQPTMGYPYGWHSPSYSYGW